MLPIIIEKNVEAPGLLETTGYINAGDYDIYTIAGLAIKKLEKLFK